MKNKMFKSGLIRNIKYRLFDAQSPLSKWEFWVCVLVIFLAAYLLAPRFWEPGGESLKNWVVARIFRQGWGFPVFNHAPLYNLYLQFFLFSILSLFRKPWIHHWIYPQTVFPLHVCQSLAINKLRLSEQIFLFSGCIDSIPSLK